ncbi:hypothetical protein VNO78_03142 [Psophocarpus tetragonolobus]|uniref:Uncharacterized protein n=1 Tax=Psophocarpus tetragonolobus TaxID=3891 RepID=A0AAN9XVC6_PSOTE
MIGAKIGVAIGLEEASHMQLSMEELRGSTSEGVVDELCFHYRANIKSRLTCNQEILRRASCEIEENGPSFYLRPKKAACTVGKQEMTNDVDHSNRIERENCQTSSVVCANGQHTRIFVGLVQNDTDKKREREACMHYKGNGERGGLELKDGEVCEERSGLSRETRGGEGLTSLQSAKGVTTRVWNIGRDLGVTCQDEESYASFLMLLP